MNLVVVENEIRDLEKFLSSSEIDTRGYRPTDVVFRGLVPAEKLNSLSEKRFALIVEGVLDLIKLIQVQLNGYRQPQAVLRFKFSQEKGWIVDQNLWKQFWDTRLKLGRDLYVLENCELERLELETAEFNKNLLNFIKEYVLL